jgi:hypothetical protein
MAVMVSFGPCRSTFAEYALRHCSTSVMSALSNWVT